ncbi:MAG: 2-hydroxyacid dehydrogenase [Oscillospiraceae bacterium]|jgi:D-lactate dehydrogenase|nr:2-hydroxyacid dehydrogenase [Oscillospiraceae bacterium]
MKLAFYDTKPYDKEWFDKLSQKYGCEIKYYEYKLSADTAWLAKGYDAVCIFVNDDCGRETLGILEKVGVKLVALRCSGYNNVDLSALGGIKAVRVPAYSPNAVAEYAAALLLSVNRRIPRAYNRTREGNFSINGLMGVDLYKKTVGVIGTGKIGQVFISICRGFGMRVIAYDPYPADDPSIEYSDLETLFKSSDVISLHCPLTKETHHIINAGSVSLMKDGCILINTSRGALVDTHALIDGLKSHKLGGAGLDVYEEEGDYFFEDFSGEVIEDDELARLLSLPNVIVSSHQAFFTREAMRAIAETTFESLIAAEKGEALKNQLVP